MILNGADITIKLLEELGIKDIIGIPGGANLPLYDSLYKSSIRHILSRHEQGAAFIAQGIARATGRAAVCFATSGPGATNLLTAIADAKLDSVPIIAITGQVPYSMIGTDAFQEVDTYGLTVPITKHNFLVRSIEELFYVIPEAFNIAENGRPGPVLIDIPKDIQVQNIEYKSCNFLRNQRIKSDLNLALIKEIAEEINKAKKPILYFGGGIVQSDASEELKQLARKSNIPAAATLMALGVFTDEDPLFLGMLGMHGARYTNYIINEADLLLAFGCRFDDRAIGNSEKFCPNAKVIHIDIDEAEVNKIRNAHLSIGGDLKDILEAMIPYINWDTREKWIDFVLKMKIENPFTLPDKEDLFHPINIIKFVGDKVPEDAIIATDVGQHQMWTAQAYPFRLPRTLLTSGGLGTMGFGLPAAIGASLAFPNRTVICFSGDGSILMNIQELATMADLDLNVKVLIMNNGHLGLVRQQQEMFYEKHYIASKFKTNPNFSVISEGFGIKGYNLALEKNPLKTLEKLLMEPGCCVIDIPIRQEENVLPIVPPGAGNTEMIGGGYYGK